MHYAALLVIFISLPILIAMIGRDRKRRDGAVLALGLLMFCTGTIEISAALISWPAWQGLSKGIILSLLDTIALALVFTRHKRLNKAHFLPLILIYAAPTVLSVAFAAEKQAAMFVVAQIAQMTVFFVALSGELQRPSAIRSLLLGLSTGLMIQAGYVVWQKASGAIQAAGTMPHQNILGMIVELTALPLLAAVLEGEKSKLVYAGLLASLIIIAGGGSRGTMLYFTIGAGVLLVLSLARRNTARKWQIVGMSALACFVAVPLAMATLNDRFGEKSVMTQESERTAFERAAAAIAVDYPLGVGANNFVSVNNLGGYAARSGLDWSSALRSKPAHNAFLVARAETGWAGEIGLILLLGGIVWAGLRAGFRMKKGPLLGITLGCAAGTLAAALHSSYEYAILTAGVQRFLFTDAAIVSACMSLMAQTARVQNKTRSLDALPSRLDCASQEAPALPAPRSQLPSQWRKTPSVTGALSSVEPEIQSLGIERTR